MAELFLVTPRLEGADAFRPALEAALAAGPVASVWLRCDGDARPLVEALGPLVQDAGAALLIDPPDDLRLVARLGADGVHAQGEAAIAAALAALKPDRIVGAGGLPGRDACMEAAERGADYLFFGDPDDAALTEETLERLAWWAELFQVPAVGSAATLDDIAMVLATGAEFVAVGDALWRHPEGVAGGMADLGSRLAAR